MDLLNGNLLTILILVPIIGAAITLVYQGITKQESQLKWTTLGFTLLNFLISLALFSKSATAGPGGFLFEQNIPWIRAINTNYHIGVDGLSFWLVLLTTFIMPITILSTWESRKRPAAFYVSLLLIESAMIGVFVSLD